jgi:hypothetical protein
MDQLDRLGQDRSLVPAKKRKKLSIIAVQFTILHSFRQEIAEPEVPRLTCSGRESNLILRSGRRALYSNKELFEQPVNSYAEPATWLPPSACGYLNVHVHPWAALGCRLNSNCKSFNSEYLHQALASPQSAYSLSSKTDHVGVTTVERLDQGLLHHLLDARDWHVPAKNRTCSERRAL